ncbi:fucolectin-like [Mustelus asterias]
MLVFYAATCLWLVVEAGVTGVHNVALNGVATQSSNRQKAGNAIDGITGDKSCSWTEVEADPWWRVDLREKHWIGDINITNTNRKDMAGIAGAEIHIGDSDRNHGNDNPKCATVETIQLGATQTFPCNGMQGRYVNIIRPGNDKQLSLCEVGVFGQPLFVIEACE